MWNVCDTAWSSVTDVLHSRKVPWWIFWILDCRVKICNKFVERLWLVSQVMANKLLFPAQHGWEVQFVLLGKKHELHKLVWQCNFLPQTDTAMVKYLSDFLVVLFSCVMTGSYGSRYFRARFVIWLPSINVWKFMWRYNMDRCSSRQKCGFVCIKLTL